MKTKLAFLALCLVLCLLCTSFVGCDGDTAPSDDTAPSSDIAPGGDTADGTEQTLVDPLLDSLEFHESFEDGKPYHLYFDSNGDGTCTLRAITTNPASSEPFALEIPESSPAGDTVTAIDLDCAAHGSYDLTGRENFPFALTPATYEALYAKAQENGMDDFSLMKFSSYFFDLTLEGKSEEKTQSLLAQYPILAYSDIYVFAPSGVLQSELEKIYEMLNTYCGWDQAQYEQNNAEILSLAKQSGSAEQAELCLVMCRVSALEQAEQLSLPKTVTTIGSDMWQSLDKLQSVTVDESHSTFKMIDDCLVDTATGTLLRCLGEGRVPEQAGIKTIGSYAFMGCELKLGEGGVREGIHLYIPEGVTTLQKDCFDGMIIENMQVFTIHLPMTLETFESPDALENIYVYTYAGTMQEWDARVSFTDVSKKNCYIYVRMSDQSSLMQFFIPKSK